MTCWGTPTPTRRCLERHCRVPSGEWLAVRTAEARASFDATLGDHDL